MGKILLHSLGILMLLFACGRQTDIIPVRKADDGKIRLSEAQIQLANIKVSEVKNGSLTGNLTLTGRLKVNELSTITVSSRSDGRIEKLFFKTTGEKVNIGDSLYNFYSDEIVTAEREHFTLQSANWNHSGQYPPSLLLENKLLFLGMVPSQISYLKKEGKILFTIPIISQVKGTVRSVYVNEGQYVKGGEKLFELASDNTLWVEAQAYTCDLPRLREGMEAKVIFPSGSDQEIPTSINYINPSYEPGKNFTVVRAIIKNPSGNLYPGMLTLLSIESQKNRGILIPLSAVISEKNNSKVFVEEEQGVFSERIIKTGFETSDSILVISGIDLSDKVVTSGAYLLNSEMILRNGSGPETKNEM